MAWQGSTRRARLPTNWNTTRQRILDRDGHRCTWIEQGQRCLLEAKEVDHITNTDDHSDSNLRSLCSPHHRAKTQAESAAARWKVKAQRPSEKHPGLV